MRSRSIRARPLSAPSDFFGFFGLVSGVGCFCSFSFFSFFSSFFFFFSLSFFFFFTGSGSGSGSGSEEGSGESWRGFLFFVALTAYRLLASNNPTLVYSSSCWRCTANTSEDLAGVGFLRAGVVEDIIGEAGRLLGVGRDGNEVGVEGGVGVEVGRLMNSPASEHRKEAGL